ncbi:G2/mitotic-specific cyclin-B3-like [Ambystoma mexicanum]|uniref:G2/mitotic-specific cyclin-B3-like n=1 Tax=Ambystoma mexicanum TaxID=8296 RepID=UPI0037E80878
MYGKRSASLRPVVNDPKKRKTQQRHHEQAFIDVENAMVIKAEKESCKKQKNITSERVKEESIGNKRNALNNITNVKKTSDEENIALVKAVEDCKIHAHATRERVQEASVDQRNAFTNISNVQIKKEKSKCHASGESKKRRTCLASVITLKNPNPCLRKKVNVRLPLKPSKLTIQENTCDVPDQSIKNIEDIDEQHKLNSFAVPLYAKAIFDNLKQREADFPLESYINRQPDIGIGERTVVVDWMVEVQENFALTHETLYLAVKLLDHYLCNHLCPRKDLQLLGITAVLISAKFVECLAPQLDDLVYVCAGEYPRRSIIEMERKILQGLEFNINIPIAYSFIRRYSQCAKVDLVTLTLARYICERTLQEFDFLMERASYLAAASLHLAMKMRCSGQWTPTLVYYTGYEEAELRPLVKKLNTLLSERPRETVRTVYNKYSDSTFLKVAAIPPLDPSSFSEN